MAIALAMTGLLSASFSLQAQNSALTATEQMAAQKAAAEKVQMLAAESGLGMSNYQPVEPTQVSELKNWSVSLVPFSIIPHVSPNKFQWQILPGVRPYSADEMAIIIKNSPRQSATMSAGQYLKDSMAEVLQQVLTFFKEVQKILKSYNAPQFLDQTIQAF